jgi:1,4-alpha-glucan branching enzyme
VALTGERGGYYADYQPPASALGRCLVEGFAYQGERSAYRGRPRGYRSAGLPPTAFVNFLQNHDQIGNRAFGERLTALAPHEALRAATAVLLLAPSSPLLFMGQEWGAIEPFLFFSDLGPDLAAAVCEGRRREFARFPQFADPATRARIPDPQAPETRGRSVLDWRAPARPPHREWLDLHRALLELRHREIVPLLAGGASPETGLSLVGETGLEATWHFAGAGILRLVANLGSRPVSHFGPRPEWGRPIHALGLSARNWVALPPWSAAWYRR